MYAVGEVVLVAFGISMALQINNKLGIVFLENLQIDLEVDISHYLFYETVSNHIDDFNDFSSRDLVKLFHLLYSLK